MSEPRFDTWSLPPGLDIPVAHEDGPVRRLVVTPAWVEGLCASLEGARQERLDRPAAEVAEVLGRVGARFRDPDDPIRAAALSWLPITAGLSPEMSAHVLDGMAGDWTTSRLGLLLEAEFGDPRILDAFVRDGPRHVRAVPRSPTLHIGSGSVPGVCATSLLRSLLVKSAVLVKPGLGDVVLTVLVHRALAEMDPALAATCAVAYWPGRWRMPVPDSVRSVVVYGDDQTIESVRARARASVRVVDYPHKVSFAVIGHTGGAASDGAVRDLARAVATFERRGCVSPHRVFVEQRRPGEVLALAERLVGALAEVSAELPAPPGDLGEAALRRQWLTTLRMGAAAGSGVRILEASGAVVVVGETGLDLSPPGRIVVLHPVEDLTEVIHHVAPYQHHLQSVALDVDPERRVWLAEALIQAGALRITTLGALPWPPAWWHHDGRGSLTSLVDLVDWER